MIKLQITDELNPVWRTYVERHIDLTLGSLRGSIRAIKIRFSKDEQSPDPEPCYCCELEVKPHQGEPIAVRTEHCHGETAIIDALVRAKRSMVRVQKGMVSC